MPVFLFLEGGLLLGHPFLGFALEEWTTEWLSFPLASPGIRRAALCSIHSVLVRERATLVFRLPDNHIIINAIILPALNERS
jgi:hypothetical protein